MTKAVHETNIKYAEKAGLKTVGTEGFAGATKNFSGVILKVKAAQPDIIFISSFDAVSVPLLQQMRQLQVKAMDVHHIMANGSLARQADLEGVTGEIYWHEGRRRHRMRSWRATSSRRPTSSCSTISGPWAAWTPIW